MDTTIQFLRSALRMPNLGLTEASLLKMAGGTFKESMHTLEYRSFPD
jgi:hypothetical protein